MIMKSIIFMALICFAVAIYSNNLSDYILVAKWQSAGKKISLLLNSIDNEFAARQAIPQLQKLTAYFNRLTAEFASRQKAKPLFRSRYAPEAIKTLRELKKSLKKLNANDTIPLVLREKIIKMLKKFKR
jgi:hypothetical protein